ncbi:MAG: hypothetical protein ACLTAV_06765 [Finegoldia magna]
MISLCYKFKTVKSTNFVKMTKKLAGGYYARKDFKKLLIDTVKISDHPDKEKSLICLD